MITGSDKKAFSLTELLIASAILVTLLASTLTGFVLLKNIFAANNAKAGFQRDAEVIVSKIIEGKGDPSGIRLSEAASVAPSGDGSSLTFVGPAGVDVVSRTYSLSGDRTSILYSDQNGQQKIIYKAPQGATVGLTFIPMDLTPTLCVYISVSVSQIINGRIVRGSLESSVYVRNHSV